MGGGGEGGLPNNCPIIAPGLMRTRSIMSNSTSSGTFEFLCFFFDRQGRPTIPTQSMQPNDYPHLPSKWVNLYTTYTERGSSRLKNKATCPGYITKMEEGDDAGSRVCEARLVGCCQMLRAPANL